MRKYRTAPSLRWSHGSAPIFSHSKSAGANPHRSRAAVEVRGGIDSGRGSRPHPNAGSLEETRKVAQNHLIRLRGVLGELALAQGWATMEELERVAEALLIWGEAPDAFYARPVFGVIGWV